MPVKRSDITRQLPMLVGLFVACTAAGAAISVSIDEPAYELTLYLVITLGLLTSLYSTITGRNCQLAAVAIIAAAFSTYAIRYVHTFPISLFYPAEVLTNRDLALAVLISWFMAGFCFVQARRQNAILCLVSGLAIFGLMGTININPELLVAFLVYLFATIYTWAYDSLLTRQANSVATSRIPWLVWGRRQLGPVAVLFVALVTMGYSVGYGLYCISPRVFDHLPELTWQWHYRPQPRPTHGQAADDQFPVGTGPLQLSDEVVFTVQADYPALWRAHFYSQYDGHYWWSERTYPQYLSPRTDGSYDIPFGDDFPGRENRQHYRVRQVPFSLVHAAAHPRRLSIQPNSTTRWQKAPLLAEGSGTIAIPAVMVPWGEYEVISVMPRATAKELASAGTAYPTQVREEYIESVPLACQAKLPRLVERITAGASTPYDKVTAILSHLSEGYLYTTQASAVPATRDAAVHFLLKTKQGACDLFATAMAVMCRLADVPARVATGYGTGTYDPDQHVYVVRGTDAHAWVEVHFPGIGWVPFDPQARESLEEQTAISLWQRGHFRLVLARVGGKVLGVLAVIAVLVLAATTLVAPRLVRSWWGAWPVARQPWSRLERQWRRFYALVWRRSRFLTPADTPGELLAAAHERGLIPVGLYPFVRRATDSLYQLRYSERPVSTSQVQRHQRRWASLCKRIRAAQRRKNY